MLRLILIALGILGAILVRGYSNVSNKLAEYHRLIESLVSRNMVYLKNNPKTPLLYSSGVVYASEFTQQEWQDIPRTLKLKHGDCEDLASWRIAELRIQGINAKPHIIWNAVNNAFYFHVQVKHPDGSMEDPSVRLGMK